MPAALLILIAVAGAGVSALVARHLVDGVALTDTGRPNVPPARLLPRLLRLSALALQLRAAGARVTSGYRAPAVNDAVNGDARSRHMDARALDFVCPPERRAACLAVLRQWKAAGDVTAWDEHDRGSGMHFHAELPP